MVVVDYWMAGMNGLAVAREIKKLNSAVPIIMLSGLAEVLIGYRVDSQVGPIVLVAAGGELAELYADRSLRLAPVDLPTAREALSHAKRFSAQRGGP